MPTQDNLKMFGKVTIRTFLPDGKGGHPRNYKAPAGAYLTKYHFPAILQQHRAMFEKAMPGVTFREVQTGPNTFSFIHPALDTKLAKSARVLMEQSA
jgi:hypothetical protein